MSFQTPLHAWHVTNGAKMVDFAGWSMPIQYQLGSIEEHRLVRRSAGLFDVSHMGQVLFAGDDARAVLSRLVTSNVSALKVNQSTYGILCAKDGGVIDDVFVYCLPEHYLVVVNASNTETDLAWFTKQATGNVPVTDASDGLAMFALQGPRAIDVMDLASRVEPSGVEAPTGQVAPATVADVPRFAAARVSMAGVSCTIGRTGYTGEDGIEIFVPAEAAQMVWEHILATAAANSIECGPIGLAARDSLRFEPGFPLYGHELTREILPVQARLKWACDLEKDFIGAEAVRKAAAEGTATKLATVKLTERGVPRQGHRVYHDGEDVGFVASGMYAPTVDAYCANVFVTSRLAVTGTELEIGIRDKKKAAVVVKRPLYKPAYR